MSDRVALEDYVDDAVAGVTGFQPSDSDLTAIAALTTTSYGRAFLALADAAAARTALGLGTAALSASGDFQPIDSDLTAIAALTTTSFGRGLLAAANAAALGIAKGDVGLGNVDNTADTAKPVSTAQQTALDLKANLASPTGTGVLTWPALAVSGLTGAASPGRFVGVTGGSAPASGTFAAGDFVIGISGPLVNIIICHIAGSPGTWASLISQTVADAIYAPKIAPLPYRTGGTFGYMPEFGGSGNLTLVQDTMYAVPFYVRASTNFSKLRVVCTAIVASAVARLGIYSDTNGVPNALVVDAGTVAVATTGDKDVTISGGQTLAAGWYWLACAMQGAAGQLKCTLADQSPGIIPSTSAFSNGPISGYSRTTVSGALPSPWGATKTESARVPIVSIFPA